VATSRSIVAVGCWCNNPSWMSFDFYAVSVVGTTGSTTRSSKMEIGIGGVTYYSFANIYYCIYRITQLLKPVIFKPLRIVYVRGKKVPNTPRVVSLETILKPHSVTENERNTKRWLDVLLPVVLLVLVILLRILMYLSRVRVLFTRIIQTKMIP
jgi:hypothetical protein